MRAARPLAAEIVVDPAVLGGTPVIRGTRVPAETVLAELRSGTPRVEILRHYPSLPLDAIEACLRWETERQQADACPSAS